MLCWNICNINHFKHTVSTCAEHWFSTEKDNVVSYTRTFQYISELIPVASPMPSPIPAVPVNSDPSPGMSYSVGYDQCIRLISCQANSSDHLSLHGRTIPSTWSEIAQPKGVILYKRLLCADKYFCQIIFS